MRYILQKYSKFGRGQMIWGRNAGNITFISNSSFASSEVKGVKGVIAPYGR